MNEQLEKKIQQAIRLIKMAGADGDVVEVAYSGGKDSDVILQLTKEAGINYRAIYKNTTIDPPKTLKHVKDNGVEIVMPELNFFQIMEKKGMPNRYRRFCCNVLKEYKILDKAILGIRREESTKRAKRYTEPTACRFFGSKKNHVEQFYPILEWSNQDIVDFVIDRGIVLHPKYYREDGSIDPTQRLGCLGCPLSSATKRIAEFKKYPNLVKAYCKALGFFIENHPIKRQQFNSDQYDWFVRELFYESTYQWHLSQTSLFDDVPNSKQFLEDYFNIKL